MTSSLTSRVQFTCLAIVLSILTPLAFISSFRLEFALGLLRHKQFINDATIPRLSFLKKQSESDFILNKLTGEPPRTRVYDFVVNLAEGAPDGVYRTMLVVNGECNILFSD